MQDRGCPPLLILRSAGSSASGSQLAARSGGWPVAGAVSGSNRWGRDSCRDRGGHRNGRHRGQTALDRAAPEAVAAEGENRCAISSPQQAGYLPRPRSPIRNLSTLLLLATSASASCGSPPVRAGARRKERAEASCTTSRRPQRLPEGRACDGASVPLARPKERLLPLCRHACQMVAFVGDRSALFVDLPVTDEPAEETPTSSGSPPRSSPIPLAWPPGVTFSGVSSRVVRRRVGFIFRSAGVFGSKAVLP